MVKRWASATLGWNVLTILLGALVRATHSGAGCGRSWPNCSGEILPELEGARAIEFVHRAASGVALLLVIGLVVLVWSRTLRGEPIRRAAAWSAGAIVGEALIGAAIVLYEWVDADSSIARVVAVPLHLVNTLLLLAALTLVLWFASGGNRLALQGPIRKWLGAGAAALVAIAATGAVTALADTLFPKDGSGLLDASHFLSDLRVVHPLLAISVVASAAIASRLAHGSRSPVWHPLAIVTLSQLGIGAANIWLGTPVWLQLVHLLVADVIWILYVWLAAQVLARSEASSVGDEVGFRHTIPEHR